MNDNSIHKAYLAVVLVHASQLVLKVVPALRAEVNAIQVKGGTPEESLHPVHLAQREVMLARHIEIGHSHVSIGVKVRARCIDGAVEGRDHCCQEGASVSTFP